MDYGDFLSLVESLVEQAINADRETAEFFNATNQLPNEYGDPVARRA
ncbi:hypothetical protein ACNTMW_04685 [Planosporangium sp. 12N6]